MQSKHQTIFHIILKVLQPVLPLILMFSQILIFLCADFKISLLLVHHSKVVFFLLDCLLPANDLPMYSYLIVEKSFDLVQKLYNMPTFI